MTIDEAIKHLHEELANPSHDWGCAECRLEHEQLLYWLTEYRAMISGRQSDSLSERLASHLVWAESNSYECPVTLAEDLEEAIAIVNRYNELPDWLPVWVSCDDNLPKSVANRCIVFCESDSVSDHIGFGHFEGSDGWFNLETGKPFEDWDLSVTHWMPLPHPPKEMNNQ